jgi:Cutinase
MMKMNFGVISWLLAGMLLFASVSGIACGDDDDDGEDSLDDDEQPTDDDDADDDETDDDTECMECESREDCVDALGPGQWACIGDCCVDLGDDDLNDDANDDADDDLNDDIDDDVDDDVDDDLDDDVDDDADDDVDDDTFPPDDCVTLEDPNLPGEYEIIPYEYGHDADPDARTSNIVQYLAFPDIYVRFGRGINMNAVPMHSVGYYPDGVGPFPVVLIVHGNHAPQELSYPGYNYLTSQLATHGFIAFSVEEDFLNGGVMGEMDARGIVLLRHLQLLREWNETPGHLLFGKINMNQVGLAGHSRGGEAVAVAWKYNTEKHNPDDPYHDFNFRIRSLYAIAPVDGQLGVFIPQLVTLEDVDYFIMHGSHDGDVSDFQGHRCYDRALPVDQETGADKGLLFVQGANHGQWNEVWAPGGDPNGVSFSTTPLISIQDQQTIGQVFITAWFRWTLQGRRCYRLMAAGEREFESFPEGIVMNRQFQSRDRVFVDHYEEDQNPDTASMPGGANSADGLAVNAEQTMSSAGNRGRFSGSTRGLIAAWNAAGGYYRVDLPTIGRDDLGDMDLIAFRAGQLFEGSDQYNTFGVVQDFSVKVVTGGLESDSVAASDYRALPSPTHVEIGGGWETSMTVLETIRIPLADFNGGAPLLPSAVEAIIFEFDILNSGLLGFDEIQFTKW